MILDYSDEIKKLIDKVNYFKKHLDIDAKKRKLTELQKEANKPNFWDDSSSAKEIMDRISKLEEEISAIYVFEKELLDIQLANKLALEGNDKDLAKEVEFRMSKLGKNLKEFEFNNIFTEKEDHLPAIITIHPGAGGTESQDWANMLMRMYMRWAEKKGFKVEIISIFYGEEAGIKYATFTIDGKFAYGLLKGENGVHRLVRLSPFDAANRRHTSFASVEVVPLIKKDIEIKLEKKDLKIETYRASGPGGQHVNVTDSAVRITHLPTGIIVQCQKERSQTLNRKTALIILISKLYKRELDLREKKKEELYKKKKEIAWGSQIRSYILHPYKLIKDHIKDLEVTKVDEVLDGDIDIFIKKYL
jgi:peptide chain release factor 2